MTRRNSRKRKRSPGLNEGGEPKLEDGHALPESEDLVQDDASHVEEMHDLWEAFKEEHYEAVEQLPLHLHRIFRLMRDLDVQTQGYQSEILKLIRAYVHVRRALAPRSSSGDPVDSVEGPAINNGGTGAAGSAVEGFGGVIRASTPHQVKPHKADGVIASGGDHHKSFVTNGAGLITRLAVLVDEWVHSGDEKLNLAKAAYDSADRYVRMLDSDSVGQKVEGGEMTISQSTLMEGAVMPEEEVNIAIGMTESSTPNRTSARKGTKTKGARISTRKRNLGTASLTPVIESEHVPVQSSFLRPQNGIDMKVLPNEPVYCYCNQVSHGSMIACDNKNCAREWFHYQCVGLVEAPMKGKTWYCPDCSEALGRNSRRKR